MFSGDSSNFGIKNKMMWLQAISPVGSSVVIHYWLSPPLATVSVFKWHRTNLPVAVQWNVCRKNAWHPVFAESYIIVHVFCFSGFTGQWSWGQGGSTRCISGHAHSCYSTHSCIRTRWVPHSKKGTAVDCCGIQSLLILTLCWLLSNSYHVWNIVLHFFCDWCLTDVWILQISNGL